jgi:hypothetical protein
LRSFLASLGTEMLFGVQSRRRRMRESFVIRAGRIDAISSHPL